MTSGQQAAPDGLKAAEAKGRKPEVQQEENNKRVLVAHATWAPPHQAGVLGAVFTIDPLVVFGGEKFRGGGGGGEREGGGVGGEGGRVGVGRGCQPSLRHRPHVAGHVLFCSADGLFVSPCRWSASRNPLVALMIL